MTTVSANEYLKAQGATFVVFHPGPRLLYLGFGCDETPRVVPQCFAYYQQGANNGSMGSVATGLPWQPDAEAYNALVEAQKFLHLPVPPVPASISQDKPQQHRQSDPLAQSQQQPGSPTSPAAPAAPAAATAASSDLFPAAKAGLISSKEVPEGSDGFAWSRTQKGGAAAAAAAAAAAVAATAAKEQQQQAGPSDSQEQQQPPQPPASAAVHPVKHIPQFLGTQVAALPPGAPYKSGWLMTPDGHIADLDALPEHMITDRIEAVWGWALAAELGLGAARRSQLAAVLLVPHDMTAMEVRLLADVLLGRLGFASLVVHLEPVAATFGNGATCACVVHVGSERSSVVCVDDAVVLQPSSSRLKLQLGLTGITAALTGWMSCYQQWPLQLQQQGLGWQGVLGARAGVYTSLVLEELAMQQCYYPKASLNPGLVGRAMLEDNPPAMVPLRIPGSPTVNFEISLGSWAAAASMAMFYPQLVPSDRDLQEQQQQQQQQRNGSDPGGSRAAGEAEDGADLLMTDVAAAAEAPGMLIDAPQHQLLEPQPATSVPGSAPASAAAAAAAAQATAVVEAQAAAAAAAARAAEVQHYRALVHDVPAAESMYLQSQHKARLEAGLVAAPPVGLYLPPIEVPAAAAGAAAGAEGEFEAQEAAAAATAGLQDTNAGDADASSSSSDMPLDEAVFSSLMAVAARQPDVLERLSAGILLVGPGASIRGLGSMLERRVMHRFATVNRQQVVSVLEPRAHPAHIAWFGGALLAALDAGREMWLQRQQWLPGCNSGSSAGAAMQQLARGPGLSSLSNSAAARHSKLFYYCRAESGYYTG